MESKQLEATNLHHTLGDHRGIFACARDKRTVLYFLSLLFDQIALIAGYLCALTFRDGEWLSPEGHPLIVIALPIFVMLEIAREAQSIEALQHRLIAIQRSLGCLAGTAFTVIGLVFLSNEEDISRLGLAVTFGAAAIFVIFGKIVLDLLRRIILGQSVLATVVLKDGINASAGPAASFLDVGARNLWPDPERPEMIDLLSRFITPYDRVIIACQEDHREAWAIFLRGHDVGGEIILDRSVLHGAVGIGEFGSKDTIILSYGPLNLLNRFQKRMLDLAIAVVGLLLLSPMLFTVAIAIKLDSPGPVLFRQIRVGQGNRQFRIFKFRSMRMDCADVAGDCSVTRDDERITRVGRIIRRTSLDELPQLINVLRGEMSMVGPRPHALGSLAGDRLFWQASKQYWLRHALKPGITGLAQIRGYRGATEYVEDLERRVHCDIEYLSDWSLWSDIMILIKTVRVIIHKNAY